MKKLKKSLKKKVFGFLRLLLIVIGTFTLTFLFVGEPMVISGSSMEPNFHDHEQILADKISYRFDKPQRGDVVVVNRYKSSGRIVIKRIIGLPEETILISHGQVFINGTKLDEPYISKNIDTQGGEFISEGNNYKIPENSYVLLGDNRNDSIDSRKWGPVIQKKIIGKAVLVYYPLDKFRVITF